MKHSKLFLKISATFLAVTLVLGLVYVFVTARTAENYFKESNQRLYGDLAEHLVQETKPFHNGKPDTAATHHIMHSMMVINPSVEVYLLDTAGKIVDYVVPYSKVKMEWVDLRPVQAFIAAKGEVFTLGDDPKSPGERNVFSAAPVQENGKTIGYAYIILAGEQQQEATSTLLGSYFLKTGTAIFLAALAGSLLVGLLVIWLITKGLRQILETVRRFKEGDRKARVSNACGSDLAVLATTFNGMADAIEANIEEMKSLENLRRELIANVSHDLRTPLAIMQGYVETLLMKENLPAAERRRHLQTVFDSSEKLSRLIAQLFEYSKLEARQIQPQKEPFFIGELAQDISQKYQVLAQQKAIRISLDQPQKLPLVFADLALVERVLQNLMDNALKFTPAGGEVKITLRETDNNVEVRISDTGPGIPESEQSAIFERYRKASAEDSRTGGAGLGLAIVKKILELHDTGIRVQSRLNEGAAFVFQLPAYEKNAMAV
jgi:signal transduction histidine kinase